jgi:hypothetical protein
MPASVDVDGRFREVPISAQGRKHLFADWGLTGPRADCQCGLGTRACTKPQRTIGRCGLLGSLQPILVVCE